MMMKMMMMMMMMLMMMVYDDDDNNGDNTNCWEVEEEEDDDSIKDFIFSNHFEKMGSDSRAMKGSYLSSRIPGLMANCIYLTRKSLRHEDWCQ